MERLPYMAKADIVVLGAKDDDAEEEDGWSGSEAEEDLSEACLAFLCFCTVFDVFKEKWGTCKRHWFIIFK